MLPSNSRYNSRFPPIHGASALAGSSLRYNTRFPPIRTFLPRINPGAPAGARDTFCAHFQLQLIMLAHQLQLEKANRVSLNSNFPSWNSCQGTNFDTRYNSYFSAIRVSPKFAFPPNSHFPQISCAPASTRENNSRSSPNPLLIRHASASSIPRKQFMFPSNSRFHTIRRQPEFEFFMQFLPQLEFLIMPHAEIQFAFSNSSSSAFASNSRSSSNPLLIHHACRENNSHRSPQFEFDIHGVSAPTPARVSPNPNSSSCMLRHKLQLAEIQFAVSLRRAQFQFGNSPNSNSGHSCWRTASSSSSSPAPNPTHRHDAGWRTSSIWTLRVSNSRSSLQGHQLPPREEDFPLRQFQF